MFAHTTVETDLSEHPAIKAWGKIRPHSVIPQAVETLKKTKTSSAYRLMSVGPAGFPIIAKRCERETALIERIMYEQVLPSLSLSALDYYGFAEDDTGDACWLFLEDAGEKEYSPVVEEHRDLAVSWMATIHTAATRMDLRDRLPDRGPTYYLALLHSTCERILQNLSNPSLSGDDRKVLRTIVSECEVLQSSWDRIEKSCDVMPQTLVHGDFVEKNVRVRSGECGTSLVLFDWEVAGWGVPAADLAECPDIPAYWSLVRQHWTHLRFEEIRELAEVGKIFRLLSALSWASWGLESEWTNRPMRYMRCYAADLPNAIRNVEIDN